MSMVGWKVDGDIINGDILCSMGSRDDDTNAGDDHKDVKVQGTVLCAKVLSHPSFFIFYFLGTRLSSTLAL